MTHSVDGYEDRTNPNTVIQERVGRPDPMTDEEFFEKFQEFVENSPPRTDRLRTTGFVAFLLVLLLVGGPVVAGSITGYIAIGPFVPIAFGVAIVAAAIIHSIVGVYIKWRYGN